MRGDETNEHVAQRGPAEALQPMRPGEILSTALELYRRTWRTLLTAGCLLLVIPGIYVGVQLAASIPALVVEGRRGRSALARSWRLVEGQWWHAFGTIVLAWLVLGFSAP